MATDVEDKPRTVDSAEKPLSRSELEGLSRSELLRASPRMFESDLLDKVSRVHPAVPPILFGPVIVAALVLGFVNGVGWNAVWLIPGGYLLWSLTEYVIHRVVFHWEPDHPIGARFHYIAHGVHHEHPNDPMRLVMPPSVSVPLAIDLCRRLLPGPRQPGFLHLHGGLPRRLPVLRHDALLRAPPPAEERRSASGCASCTCATTSRTPTSRSGSAPRTGTRSSGPLRPSGHTRTAAPHPAADTQYTARTRGEVAEWLKALAC